MTGYKLAARPGRLMVFALVIVVLCLMAWIPFASAQQSVTAPAQVCSIFRSVSTCVSPPSAARGSQVTLSGNAWPFDLTIGAYFLDSKAVLWKGATINTGSGSWSQQVTVPSGAALGLGYWEIGPVDDSVAALPFTVTAASPAPAPTSTHVIPTAPPTSTGTVAPTATSTQIPPTAAPTAIPSAGYCQVATYYQTCIHPAQGPAAGNCPTGIYLTGGPANGALGYPPFQEFTIYFTDAKGITNLLEATGTFSNTSIYALLYLPQNAALGMGHLVVADSFGSVFASLPYTVTPAKCWT